MFGNIMREVRRTDELTNEELHDLLYKNEVLRRAIVAFGDPYHIGNLCVTWASMFTFGGTKKADYSQVHHRQLF